MHTAGLRVTFLVLLAAVGATLVLLAPASAAPNKPYSIVICGGGQTGCTSANPAVTAPGGTTLLPSSLSVTFTNDNKLGTGIKLGSDNLNVPATPRGFAVISTSLPPCPAKFNNKAPACFLLLNGGTTVGFRNLNLVPGQSISITMSALTPAPSATACTTTSPCLWTDEAKQANDFHGNGNDLNSNSNSAYGTVTSSVASCAQGGECITELANGGTGSSTSAPGSIDVTVTSSGQTATTQLESIDFGPPLVDDPQNSENPVPNCSGVTSPHLTYENLSNGADADRTQTITIKTTDFPAYISQDCLETGTLFTQLVIASDGTESLAPANQVTLPDGTAGCASATGCPAFVGLLPDCSNPPPVPPVPQALQVDCSELPGVVSRQTQGTIHTLVATVPPGFDWRTSN